MTEEETYNAILEYERRRIEYVLRSEPWRYTREKIEKEWYRREWEEEQKIKELRKHGWNLPYPPIII